MSPLPQPQEILKQTKQLARIIKLTLFAIEEQPTLNTTILLTADFNLKFTDVRTDIYVEGAFLVIPIMAADKLNALPSFLKSVDLPYVFEHEACHLIDNLFCKENNLEMAEHLLESRAEHIEILCAENKG